MTSSLKQKHCKPCEGGMPALTENEIKSYLKELDSWKYSQGKISREFTFKNYYETTAFVNAAVWIAHREDHHPDIEFGYKTCRVSYHTHALKGLTENDFICAKMIDQLLEGYGNAGSKV